MDEVAKITKALSPATSVLPINEPFLLEITGAFPYLYHLRAVCADCQCQGFCGVGKAPRAAGRLSRDIREVYERACAHLHVQPSRAFSKQCKHAVVELRDSKMGPGDIKPIAIALVRESHLCVLDLSHNNLGALGVSYIAEMLQENKSIVDLNLSATNPGREGIRALSETLRHNRSLSVLRLEENRIEHTDSQLLADIIKTSPSLRSLHLGHNRLGYYGGAAIAEAIAHNNSLGTLDLQWNHIRRDSAASIARALGGVPVDQEFINMVKTAQETRVLRVKHEEVITMATSDQKREHDPTNLSRFDPIMVLFEYMKLDNLRVIDMFQFMDTRKREKLSRNDMRDGLNTLKIPLTEYALDVIIEKLDLNKDGFVELDEMMKVHRETMRQIKLRTIKAKAKKREDESLNSLRQTLRDVIKKRKEENETRRDSVAKTTQGRKSSVGVTGLMASLQMTKTKQSRSNAQRPKKSLQAGITE
ncbi:hypothetical protein C0Q70_05617 [Pomacea canaliculata]|uniref:EF-hand domain-containing protein n=1 Tax=Pomacea canaliculata TaxID=400727 RepID=A0A2T7PLP0_POMCA|nr:hypothetical protein C0Q70_05617 [Pomacea canaliculata]